jgi:hypothetical protein
MEKTPEQPAEEPPELHAPELPGGLMNRLKQTFSKAYRSVRPLSDDETQANMRTWRKELGIGPEGDISTLTVRPNRCCVMNIPGVGERCSSAPTDDYGCRRLAQTFHPDATSRFYPQNPCASGCPTLS